MKIFLRDRGIWPGMIILIMLGISLAQAGISYTMTLGRLRHFLPDDASLFVTILALLRYCLVFIMFGLWVMKRTRALFGLIILANAVLTLSLLDHADALVTVLFGVTSRAVVSLLFDVVLMMAVNIMIFSIWYWVIDPPGIGMHDRSNERWDFLFPQRGGNLPHYESWVPHYPDYLYVAFTNSFAFSPTDTLPLTARAKMLMLLQSAISIVTLTAIAGSAINILAGNK